MAIQSAVGYSEDIEESYKAGIEIGEMILEKTDLQKNSVGILFCNIEFDFPGKTAHPSHRLYHQRRGQ